MKPQICDIQIVYFVDDENYCGKLIFQILFFLFDKTLHNVI